VGQPFVAVQAGKNVSFEGIEFEDGESTDSNLKSKDNNIRKNTTSPDGTTPRA
jgi:hypothetical protein